VVGFTFLLFYLQQKVGLLGLTCRYPRLDEDANDTIFFILQQDNNVVYLDERKFVDNSSHATTAKTVPKAVLAMSGEGWHAAAAPFLP
jgi:hypothetical protein